MLDQNKAADKSIRFTLPECLHQFAVFCCHQFGPGADNPPSGARDQLAALVGVITWGGFVTDGHSRWMAALFWSCKSGGSRVVTRGNPPECIDKGSAGVTTLTRYACGDSSAQ
jgi:hypothetical protein